MTSRYLALAMVCVALAGALSMQAVADPVYTTASEALIRQILVEMELEYTLTYDDERDPTWTFTHLGILVTIVSYDETVPGCYASLLFFAGWAVDDPIPLSVVNDWNRSTRFGRAYVDVSGDPVIELDLLLSGGVTAQTIKDYITVFAGAALKLGAMVQPQ
jgi:hypothetical protein